MNELKLTGTVKKVLPVNSGTGNKGSWTKQEILITLPGQYPKDVILTAWNDLTKLTANLKEGAAIVAYISLESREYNNRWYTEAKAYKLELPNDKAKIKEPVSPEEESDDLPF